VSEAVITVGEAERAFPELLARARNEQISFAIIENGQVVARLSPTATPARTCADLARRISNRPRLSPQNAQSWGARSSCCPKRFGCSQIEMGLIIDTALLIAHERKRFDLPAFLAGRGEESLMAQSLSPMLIE